MKHSRPDLVPGDDIIDRLGGMIEKGAITDRTCVVFGCEGDVAAAIQAADEFAGIRVLVNCAGNITGQTVVVDGGLTSVIYADDGQN